MTDFAVSDFKGKDDLLIQSIDALLEMDAKGILVPHGIGGHARTLLKAAKAAIEQAARTVPDEAVVMLADVIHELENGFVRCASCGDQEDTATLDCMDSLRRIHCLLSAAPEGK